MSVNTPTTCDFNGKQKKMKIKKGEKKIILLSCYWSINIAAFYNTWQNHQSFQIYIYKKNFITSDSNIWKCCPNTNNFQTTPLQNHHLLTHMQFHLTMVTKTVWLTSFFKICSSEERNWYRFGTTWGWRNDKRILIIPLKG